MKIYTKTGDTGETGLFGGPRLRKDHPRIEAYGTVDELNAQLGVVRAAEPSAEVETILARVQNELFDLGAELATPASSQAKVPTITPRHIQALESDVDRLEANLAPLTQFILPGGTRTSAELHVARTVCRRAERRVVTLAAAEPVSGESLIYLNRLGDLLFVMARHANHTAGVDDIAWEKAK